MEIIEKQTIKEVPVDGNYGYGYGRKDINGKANAGLTLGIIGTALGAWALFGNRRSSVIEHYHNCSELFKSWFGEDIDQKVIEAAILFWFKDDDCKSNSKLWNHFKEN